MYVCMYICIHVCMHACMCVCIYVRLIVYVDQFLLFWFSLSLCLSFFLSSPLKSCVPMVTLMSAQVRLRFILQQTLEKREEDDRCLAEAKQGVLNRLRQGLRRPLIGLKSTAYTQLTHAYKQTYIPTYIHAYIHTYIHTHPTYLSTYVVVSLHPRLHCGALHSLSSCPNRLRGSSPKCLPWPTGNLDRITSLTAWLLLGMCGLRFC